MLSRSVPILVVLILEIFVYVNGSIDFEKTIREASYNIDLIYQRYEFYKPNYQFFLGSSNMDT